MLYNPFKLFKGSVARYFILVKINNRINSRKLLGIVQNDWNLINDDVNSSIHEYLIHFRFAVIFLLVTYVYSMKFIGIEEDKFEG